MDERWQNYQHNSDGTNPETGSDFATPGEIYEYRGVKFNIGDECSPLEKNRLQAITLLVEEINFYLDKSVTEVTVTPAEDHEPGGQVTDEDVFLSERELAKASLESTAWHEFNHLFFNQMRGSLSERIDTGAWKDYGEQFEPLFNRVMELSLTPGTDRRSARNWERDFKKNSLLILFNAHVYVDEDIDLGHPYLHMGELFCYASEIMRYHSQELLAKITLLDTEEEKELAYTILDKVARTYVEKVGHPPNLDLYKQFLIEK